MEHQCFDCYLKHITTNEPKNSKKPEVLEVSEGDLQSQIIFLEHF